MKSVWRKMQQVAQWNNLLWYTLIVIESLMILSTQTSRHQGHFCDYFQFYFQSTFIHIIPLP